jgi:hypothetical protein
LSNLFKVLSAVLLIAASAAAQDFRATILGQVKDFSGAAIPNATVKATRVDNNQVTEAKTTADGHYTIPYLNPGTYNVEVTCPGFKSYRNPGIELRTADKRELKITLEVGDLAQEVTVVAQQENIETATASRGLNFDPIKTQEYPLNGRQTYMLMALTPGVIFTQEQFGASGYSGTRGWDISNAYKINGGRPGESQFLLNGAPISDKDGTWQIAPNVEAVQEFKVMTNTYDAQFGKFTGGIVNTTIKSGTNEWHGSVFEYFRNAVLDANTTQNNRVGQPRAQHHQNQFGGVIGGPLRKDKDFVFFSFEGWRETIPFSVVSNVPPAALRDGQHFSQFGYNIYDPLTTHACGGPGEACSQSAYYRNPFPGNVIPTSRISPIGVKILDLWPAPNGPDPTALAQNYFASTNAGRYRYDQPMGRWDHVFGQNDRFYAMASVQHGSEYRNSNGFPAPAEDGDIFSQRTPQTYIADWTHILGPSAVLDIRGSFGRLTQIFPRTESFDFSPDQLGMNMPRSPNAPYNIAPRFTLENFTSARNNTINWNTYNQYDFLPSLTWTKGAHSLHFGFEYNYTWKAVGDTGYGNGIFDFDRGWTQRMTDRNTGASDGSSVASLLLGLPNSSGGSSSYVEYRDTFFRYRPYYAFYVQDDWKVAPTLTLNLGVRYDVQVPFAERYDRLNAGFAAGTVNPLSDQVTAAWRDVKAKYDANNPQNPFPAPPQAIYGGLLFPNKDGQPKRPYDIDWNTIAPRIGMAWQFTPKTVLRAGFGIFYRSPTQENTTTGFSQNTYYNDSLDGITPSACSSGSINCSSGPYSLADPFPQGLIPVAGSSLGLLTNIGNGIGFDSRKVPMPRSYQYSFGFERELPGGMVGEVSYSGNYEVHETYSYQMNAVPYDDFLKGQANPNYLNQQVPNPFYGILPVTSSFGGSPTISRYNLLRPFPVFGDITSYTLPKATYRYDALQVRLEKRAFASKSAGVMTFVLSYTFSKAFEKNHRLNNWNINEDLIYELDYQDKPQNFAFSGVWDLPLGTGRKLLNVQNPVAKALANDWRFTWIYTYYSGYPSGWPDLINVCGDWHYTGSGNPFDHWFNNDKSCYRTRPAYTLRVNPDRFPDIRNPAEPQINLAIEKTIRFNERYSMLLRGEGFNITNTPMYGGPDTSFSSSRFGMIPLGQQNFPRFFQLAAKIMF